MTNDKTVTMSRELDEAEARHTAVKNLHDIMQAVPCSSLYSLAEAVLDAGYAAPVVERQDLIAPYDAIFHAVSDSVDVISRGSISISVKDFQSSLAANGYSVSPPAPVILQALRDAYEDGYCDGQNKPNGYSDKIERDKCADGIYKAMVSQ